MLYIIYKSFMLYNINMIYNIVCNLIVSLIVCNLFVYNQTLVRFIIFKYFKMPARVGNNAPQVFAELLYTNHISITIMLV